MSHWTPCCLRSPARPQPQAGPSLATSRPHPIYTSVHSTAPSPTQLSSVLHFLLLPPPLLRLSPHSYLRHHPGVSTAPALPPAPKACAIGAHAAGSGSGSQPWVLWGGCGWGTGKTGAGWVRCRWGLPLAGACWGKGERLGLLSGWGFVLPGRACEGPFPGDSPSIYWHA